MKIYEFNYQNGEIKSWVYAEDEKEAIECFCRESGDVKDRHTITELPREQWKQFYILDINESEPDPDEVEYNEDDYDQGYLIDGTFEDLVKDQKKAFYITSSDWDF